MAEPGFESEILKWDLVLTIKLYCPHTIGLLGKFSSFIKSSLFLIRPMVPFHFLTNNFSSFLFYFFFFKESLAFHTSVLASKWPTKHIQSKIKMTSIAFAFWRLIVKCDKIPPLINVDTLSKVFHSSVIFILWLWDYGRNKGLPWALWQYPTRKHISGLYKHQQKWWILNIKMHNGRNSHFYDVTCLQSLLIKGKRSIF